MTDLAKIFWNGRSQAVRLPREYRFEGTEVHIRREGPRVILEPAAPSTVQDVAAAAAGEIDRLRDLLDEGMTGEGEPWDAEEIKRLGRAMRETES